MILLGLDTSSLACSVALDADGRRYERHATEARQHTRLLLPMIRDVLQRAGRTAADIDTVILGNGPGSFVGLRIAASVAQGLCHGSGATLIPVSSLAVVAAEAIDRHAARRVLVAQDAHLGEVYLAQFDADADGLPVSTKPARLQASAGIPDLVDDCMAAGAGWQRYPALWEANRGQLAGRLDILYPHAAYLLPLGRRALQDGGAVDPGLLEPAYVREQVAMPSRGATP